MKEISYTKNDQSTENPQELFSIAEHKDDSPTKQLESSTQENGEPIPGTN